LTRCAALACLALLPLALLACGEDSSSGGTSYSRDAEPADFNDVGDDVSDDTQIQDLSTDERQALCTHYAEYYGSQLSEQEVKDFACTFAGFFTAAFSSEEGQFDTQVCEQVRSQCLTEPLEEEPDSGEGDCAPEDFEGCEATLAEVEACAQEQVQQFKDLAATFSSCSSIDPNAEVTLGEEDLGPACQALQDKCPDAFQDDEEDASSQG
jgi:hypothetical protein